METKTTECRTLIVWQPPQPSPYRQWLRKELLSKCESYQDVARVVLHLACLELGIPKHLIDPNKINFSSAGWEFYNPRD